jgi:hypothetical protein
VHHIILKCDGLKIKHRTLLEIYYNQIWYLKGILHTIEDPKLSCIDFYINCNRQDSSINGGHGFGSVEDPKVNAPLLQIKKTYPFSAAKHKFVLANEVVQSYLQY